MLCETPPSVSGRFYYNNNQENSCFFPWCEEGIWKVLAMTGIFSTMTLFAILLSRFHFSECIQWNSSDFFLSNTQIAWVHLFFLISDSSSKKMHIAQPIFKQSAIFHLKRKSFPNLVPCNFACYFYPLLILKG